MTDQQPDPQQPDPQQPASPYGNPAPEASEVTQATPVTPPTQETPVSSPYAAPSYQPYGQSAPSYDQGQPYAAPQQHAQPQQPQPYAAPQQYGQPQQPSYGSTAPDYGQPQQYAQPAYDAQQQYAQPQQQYAQPQQYGQQYGAPVYGAAGYGQSEPTRTAVSPLARVGAVGAIVGSLLAILGAFLNWLTATLNIPILAQGDISVTANGVGGVGVTLPNDSSTLRQFADGVTSGGGITTGWIVIVLAVVVLVLAVLTLLGKLPLPGAIAAIVGGLIILGLAIYKISQISTFLDTDELKSSGVTLTATYKPGIGLWVTLVAGILVLASGVLALLRRS